MQIKLSACATVFSEKEQFPNSTVRCVVVSNRDGCTYQRTDDVAKGRFNVDFDLRPLQQAVKLTDTLKFHIFVDDLLVIVASGHVPMEMVAKCMSEPGFRGDFVVESNFKAVGVHIQIDPCITPLYVELPQMQPLVLKDTKTYAALFNVFAGTVRGLLGQTTEISPQKGANMFANLLTAHNFQGELTTHVHFQHDIEPTKEDSELFFLSGLTMLAAAEALHVQGVEAEVVLKWDVGSREFTEYCAMAVQAFQRSAHICPYLSDFNVKADLDAMGRMQMDIGESFKLPFREPYHGSATKALYVHADDCDGFATFMVYIKESFAHLYDDHLSFTTAPAAMQFDTPLPDNINNNNNNNISRRYFPDHLFNMTDSEKDTLLAVALKMGKAFKEKKLRCDVTLLSAGSAAFGEGEGTMGGHATCMLSNWSNPLEPFDIMMEGTNSIYADTDSTSIMIQTAEGLKSIPIIDICNNLTLQINGPIDRANNRFLQHVNLKTHSVFYKTAFCQNGVLLATPIGPDSKSLSYGVNMADISDYNKKIMMPVDASMLDNVVKTKGTHELLQGYCRARRDEIHPPRVPLERVNESLGAWSPMTMFKCPDAIRNRPFKVCLSSTSERDLERRMTIFKAAQEVANAWNNHPRDKNIGHFRVLLAFDSVYKILSLYTDDMSTIQRALSNSSIVSNNNNVQNMGA